MQRRRDAIPNWPLPEPHDELSANKWNVASIADHPRYTEPTGRAIQRSQAIPPSKEEDRFARIEERLTALENERGFYDVLPEERTGTREPHPRSGVASSIEDPLQWIRTRKDLQITYSGMHIAVARKGEVFYVRAANHDLADLLDSLGSEVPDVYIHHFI